MRGTVNAAAGRSAAGTPLLAGAARELLASQDARRNARRLQQVFAAAGGPGAAADAIIGLAGQHQQAAGQAQVQRR